MRTLLQSVIMEGILLLTCVYKNDHTNIKATYKQLFFLFLNCVRPLLLEECNSVFTKLYQTTAYLEAYGMSCGW